jgi:hypothetical protein
VGAKSAVAKASSKSDSVRATIPEDIAKDLKLQVGDILDWSIVEEKGKKYAKFRKLE